MPGAPPPDARLGGELALTSASSGAVRVGERRDAPGVAHTRGGSRANARKAALSAETRGQALTQLEKDEFATTTSLTRGTLAETRCEFHEA